MSYVNYQFPFFPNKSGFIKQTQYTEYIKIYLTKHFVRLNYKQKYILQIFFFMCHYVWSWIKSWIKVKCSLFAHLNTKLKQIWFNLFFLKLFCTAMSAQVLSVSPFAHDNDETNNTTFNIKLLILHLILVFRSFL